MKNLTEDEETEATNILRKRFKHYSKKAIKAQIDTLNHLRKGTMKITDWLVPNVTTYEDWLLDTGLIKFINTS